MWFYRNGINLKYTSLKTISLSNGIEVFLIMMGSSNGFSSGNNPLMKQNIMLSSKSLKVAKKCTIIRLKIMLKFFKLYFKYFVK